MNRFRVSVVGSVLFIAVAVAFVLTASNKSAAQKPQDAGPAVNIGGPLPLPVTGTLSFANGSAVTVNNTASSPVLVRDVDRGMPFQKSASSVNSAVSFGQVPPGQRWIIEHVSAVALGSITNA